MTLPDRGVIFSPGTDPRYAGGHVQIPSIIMRSPQMDPGEKTLYGILLDYAWGKGEAWPSQQTLAEDMGRSDRQVRTWLNRLVKLGLIRINQRGLQMPNLYEIIFPLPEWLTSRTGTPDRKNPSGQELNRPDRKNASSPERKSASGPGRQRTSAKEDSVNTVLLSSEKKPKSASALGNGSEQTLFDDEINSARAPARERKTISARTKGNPDVRPLLQRHAQCYADRVGAPTPISWTRDGAIMKRLLATYSREQVAQLQDTFFAQTADSQAARRGYTVTQLAYEAPALMAAIKAREGLTEEQRELITELRAEGVTEGTAVAIVTEHPAENIRGQIAVQADRRSRYANPAAVLVKAIREGWAVAEEEPEPDYYRPLDAARRKDVSPPPPEVQALLDKAIIHLTGRKAGA